MITALEVIDKLESYSFCFKNCNELPSCYYVDLTSDDTCALYDKTAYFYMESFSNSHRQLFFKKRYAKKYLNAIKLLNHFRGPLKNNLNENTCWHECLRVRECAAASFSYKDADCFLFRKDEFNATRELDFVTIAFAEDASYIDIQLVETKKNNNQLMTRTNEPKMEKTDKFEKIENKQTNKGLNNYGHSRYW